MSNLVVKDNRLVNSTYYLELVEQRIVLLAIVVMRELGETIDSSKLIRFTANDYVKLYGVERTTAYETLKDAVQNLRKRYIVYKDKNPQTGHDRSFECNWVCRVGYEEGSATVYVQFTEAVLPLITRLDQSFTSYQLEKVSRLRSKYAIRLYEILMSWKGLKKTPEFKIDELKGMLGVFLNEYKDVTNFKNKVIEVAINQVNKYTDIIVKFEQYKSGRTITGYSFKFKFKDEVLEGESKEVKFKALTPRQAISFSDKLSKASSEIGFTSVFESIGTESYDEYADRIAEKLLKAEYVEKWHKYLEKVGYVSNV